MIQQFNDRRDRKDTRHAARLADTPPPAGSSMASTVPIDPPPAPAFIFSEADG
jgi:hypothetical protein